MRNSREKDFSGAEDEHVQSLNRRQFLGAVAGLLSGSEKVMPAPSQQTDKEPEIDKQNLFEIKKSIEKLTSRFGLKPDEFAIVVNPASQELCLVKNGVIEKIYKISTAKNGLGNQEGSSRTPIGTHRIAEKIGEGAEVGTIFVGTQNTGKRAKIFTDKTNIENDPGVTRLMWLAGMEPSVNKGGPVDSHKRGILIHGTHEEGLLGSPASHGCVRMKNTDVIELFNTVLSGTLVEIQNRKYTGSEGNGK